MSRRRLRTTLVATVTVLSAVAMPFLPGSLPRSFGVPIGVDVWVSRAASAFLLPAAAILIYLLLGRLTAADPLRANYDRFRSTCELALDVGLLLVLGLHATLLAALLLGPRPWLGHVPPILLAASAIVVGNALPRIRPNAVMGVTTTWARRDERAWAATHRIGGYVLVAFGLLIVAATFFARRWLGWFVGLGFGATWLLLALVSWMAWRAQHTEGS